MVVQRTSARRQGLEPTHGQRAFSQDWGPEEPRAARGSGAFTRSDEQHGGMPPPGDGTPRGAGAAGGTPENASGRAAAAIEAAAGEFEHEFNLAMLPGLGAEEIVELAKSLQVVHDEAASRGVVMPSTEGPWTSVDIGKAVAY